MCSFEHQKTGFTAGKRGQCVHVCNSCVVRAVFTEIVPSLNHISSDGSRVKEYVVCLLVDLLTLVDVYRHDFSCV